MPNNTTGKRRITFSIEAEPGSDVSVAGSFNGWDLLTLKAESGERAGHFRKGVLLEPGRYEYKFMINGTWSIDPNCPAWSPNEHGSLNSVIEVS